MLWQRRHYTGWFQPAVCRHPATLHPQVFIFMQVHTVKCYGKGAITPDGFSQPFAVIQFMQRSIHRSLFLCRCIPKP